jgi:hypothetical protein
MKQDSLTLHEKRKLQIAEPFELTACMEQDSGTAFLTSVPDRVFYQQTISSINEETPLSYFFVMYN